MFCSMGQLMYKDLWGWGGALGSKHLKSIEENSPRINHVLIKGALQSDFGCH